MVKPKEPVEYPKTVKVQEDLPLVEVPKEVPKEVAVVVDGGNTPGELPPSERH